MARICEHFKLNKNGKCKNYIENKTNNRKEPCNYSCKVIEAKSNQKSKMRKLLDNQIIDISVSYETKGLIK